MSFRDSSMVIIETSRTTIRAGHGLHDLLKTPSVEFLARVGLRKTSDVNGNGSSAASTSRFNLAPSLRLSSLPQNSLPTTSVKDYLVGAQLDEALASGQDMLISWPFADGDVRDWVQAEALWKHAIFNQLHLRRTQNESPFLLSIFPGLQRSSYEHICQIFFERFNVAGLGILDRPMAQLYSVNSLSGVVVDVGLEKTDVSTIYEGMPVHPRQVSTTLGIQDCERYLAHLLRSSQSVMAAVNPPETPAPSPDVIQDRLLEFSKFVWEQGYIKVPSTGESVLPDEEGVTDIAAIVMAGKEKAVIESGMKKKQTAKQSAAEQARAREIEAMDLVAIQWKGKEITLGKERHRFCEPLFDPELLKNIDSADYTSWDPSATESETESPLPLQDVVGQAVLAAEVDYRQELYRGLLVTGDLTHKVKGIGIALQSRLAPYVVSNPDNFQTDVQPKNIRVLGLPEYYPEYRDTGEGYAAFLGTSIVAKITYITDTGSKNFVSKSDYSTRGPHAIVEASPSLF